MTYQIFKFLKTHITVPHEVDTLIVSTFCTMNNLEIQHNEFLKQYIITSDQEKQFGLLNEFIRIIKTEKKSLTLEDLIELFEFVISPQDKEINGAVYTPAYIREFIINQIIDPIPDTQLGNKKYADIACGCGGFFFTLAIAIHDRTGITFAEIYNRNLYGIDIQGYSINRTKILLSLLAVMNGEDIPQFTFNLVIGNSLEFDWSTINAIQQNKGFDVIVGNPSYVGASKIDKRSRELLIKWSVASIGKPDLYIPFFQIALENLCPGGVLGYITVNNFYRSLNGRGIRQYLSKNRHPITIIDFGAEQVFRKRSTYTCLCFIKNESNGSVRFIKYDSKSLKNLIPNDYINIEYHTISDHKGWLLQDSSTNANIHIIESTGLPLGKFSNIKNGFATLKNDVYIFSPKTENDNYYFFEKEGTLYQIEKNICRDVIKPNTLKSESEIISRIEKLIFPYVPVNNDNLLGHITTQCLMAEDYFREHYPYAFQYLFSFKTILDQRDKGQREYSNWYAFGRTQAINIVGCKLLFPYIAEKPYFVIAEQQDLLFYNGYALISDDLNKLKVIQKVLSSNLFWYYIKQTSKPYGSGYYALAKNYVKNFGIYQFSSTEETKLLSLKNQKDIDKYLCKLYGIDLCHICI